MERARRGDESSFATLAVRIADRMYATGNHVLIPRDADQDDDAAQQAMINICRELPEGAERRIGGGSAYPLLTAFWALAVALRDIAWLARSSSAQS